MPLSYWIVLILLCAIPTIISGIIINTIIHRRLGKSRPYNNWRFVTYALILPVIVFYAHLPYYQYFSSTSRVDVSPLTLLSAEQIGQAGDFLMQLDEDDGIVRWFGTISQIPSGGGLGFNYSFYLLPLQIESGYLSARHSGTSFSIAIRQYYCEQDAIYDVRPRVHSDPASQWGTYIENNNGTEAFLRHPNDIRNQSDDADWLLQSTIRIGNTTVILRELRQRHNLHDDLSSIFIQWLVDEIINTEAD